MKTRLSTLSRLKRLRKEKSNGINCFMEGPEVETLQRQECPEEKGTGVLECPTVFLSA